MQQGLMYKHWKACMVGGLGDPYSSWLFAGAFFGCWVGAHCHKTGDTLLVLLWGGTFFGLIPFHRRAPAHTCCLYTRVLQAGFIFDLSFVK